MAKVTTKSITARAMRDICKEAIPLYLRRKGATDIDMSCLERIVFLAIVEGKEVGKKLGYDKGQEVGFDRGHAHGLAEGHKKGMRDEREKARAARGAKLEFAADADGVPGKSARVIATSPMEQRVAKAIKKIRRVTAVRAPMANPDGIGTYPKTGPKTGKKVKP